MDVLNPWMLAGLAGVTLPVLIHLLARRRLPVIDWGAMQFLQTPPSSRRSLSIDAWLLLLLRIVALALLALALTRPWTRGNLLGWSPWSPPRDVAIVLDGSYSTAVPIAGKPLYEALRDEVLVFVEGLSASSTVQIFDAREAAVPLLQHRGTAGRLVLAAMQELRPPTGSSHLPQAVLTAMRDLLDAGHVHRDVVVFADDQAHAWRPDDAAAWSAVDGQLRQSAIPPRLSVILRPSQDDGIGDVGWETASLSRERMLPGQNVVVHGQLKNWGSTPQQRRVSCLLNGLPLGEHQTTIRLPPGYTTPVAFEIRLPTPGQHAISLRSEADLLPGNDRVEFIAEVVTGVNVLLVDGTPAEDPLRSEIFFAKAALENSDDGAGWVKLTTISAGVMTPETINTQDVVMLANLAAPDATFVASLESFVARGGAVLVALGDQSAIPDDEAKEWRDWLPVELTTWHDPTDAAGTVTNVAAESLTLPWVQRFRPDQGSELCEARFHGWWATTLARKPDRNQPVVIARLANGDPWLVSARRGQGTIFVATSPLDADGNTLPAKPDYVAWLHELLLSLSEPPQRRNVAVGERMLRRALLPDGEPGLWFDPWGRPLPTNETANSAVARWPGIYVAAEADAQQMRGDDPQHLCGTADIDAFAAQCDNAESDRTTLTDAERATLSTGRPLRFYESVGDWQRDQAAEAPRSEFGWSLLWTALGVLMIESLVTRRRAFRVHT